MIIPTETGQNGIEFPVHGFVPRSRLLQFETRSCFDAAPLISSRSEQRATGGEKIAAMRRARAYDPSACVL